MASKSLGTLTLDLIAKTGGFTGPMDKAARQTKKNSDQMAKYGKAVGTAIGVGATAAAAGIVLMIQRERDLIDEQAKVAQKLDTTYESMANLRRAGELGGVGFNTIETAGRTLNANIGKAIQGVTLQADAFERLGLSAQEVYDVPLDQRIAMINKALDENVSASERAAVAGDLFGTRNAAAIQQLDPGTIAEAARQVEIFGLNLSDVDAAKVEMANDAMSTFGLLADGIGKQLTVELAPALKALGDEFLTSAEEAGGLGDQVQGAVEKSVNALAFVMDAVDGVGVVFGTVGRTASLVVLSMNEQIYEFADSIYNGPIEAFNELISVANQIPGVDIEPRGLTGAGAKIRNELELVRGAIAAGQDDLQTYLNTPLAGERFKTAYKAAQEAGEAAAEAAVLARSAADETGTAYEAIASSAGSATDEIGRQISALERAAKVWGMTADEVQIYELRTAGATDQQLEYAESLLETVAGFEAAKKAQDDYAKLVDDLRTDEEKLTDQLGDRLDIMKQMADLSDDDKNNAYSRIAADAIPDMPSFDGLDPSIGGAFGELAKVDKAEEALEEWYETQLKMLENFREEKSELNEQWDDEELKLKQQHEEQLMEIEQARRVAQMAAGEEAFGNMADAAKVFFGENSKLYRAAFAVEKSYAIGKALMNVPKSYSDAFAAVVGIPIVGPVLAPAAGVAAATAQVAQAAAIGNIGMAHDGMDSIPKTGSWILEKGERVTTAETSAKLDGVLEDIRSNRAGAGGMGGGGNTFYNTFNVPERMNRQTQAQINQSQAREQSRVQARFGK